MAMGSFSNCEGVGGADCKLKTEGRSLFLCCLTRGNKLFFPLLPVSVTLRKRTTENEIDLTTCQQWSFLSRASRRKSLKTFLCAPIFPSFGHFSSPSLTVSRAKWPIFTPPCGISGFSLSPPRFLSSVCRYSWTALLLKRPWHLFVKLFLSILLRCGHRSLSSFTRQRGRESFFVFFAPFTLSFSNLPEDHQYFALIQSQRITTAVIYAPAVTPSSNLHPHPPKHIYRDARRNNTSSFLQLKCAECDLLYCAAQWGNCVLSLEGKNELEEKKYQRRMYAFQQSSSDWAQLVEM